MIVKKNERKQTLYTSNIKLKNYRLMKRKMTTLVLALMLGSGTMLAQQQGDAACCNGEQKECCQRAAIENIMTRTSIRKYKQQPVEDAKIETMLRAAMAAPTAVNRQPWHFVVVTDKQVLNRLAGEGLRGDMLRNAPLAIVVCGDMSKALEGPMREFWVQDTSAATENLLLAAHALGLGAVWTGVYPNTERAGQVAQILGMPETIIPLCTVVIGYPDEQPTPKDKWKPENVSYNQFGGQK